MPSIDYARLRGRLRIVELLSRMGWHATEVRGEQLRGPCPFCAQGHRAKEVADRPSAAPTCPGTRSLPRIFSVHRMKNLYRCFRCGAAGNALELWSTYRGLSLYAAAVELLTELPHADASDPGLKQPPTADAPTANPATAAATNPQNWPGF